MTSYSFGHVPVLLWASSPTYESIPTTTPWLQERPTMEGNTARGASSPAKPALHTPEPLSTTSVTLFSSHIQTSHTKSKTTYESKLKETCRHMNLAWEEPSVYEIYTSGCRNSWKLNMHAPTKIKKNCSYAHLMFDSDKLRVAIYWSPVWPFKWLV